MWGVVPERAATAMVRRRTAARRDAAYYLTGMTAALLGGSTMVLVAGVWVKDLSGSSSLAALVSACVYAPSAFGLLAGLVADRVRRKPLLAATNGAAAIAMLLLLAVRSDDQLWLIYVVMTCYGTALVLTDPAEQGLFVALLSTEERRRINGARMAIQEGGKIAAPLLGVGLYAAIGGGPVAFASAVAFAVAAVVISRLRVSEPSPSAPRGRRRGELVAGFKHIARRSALRTATAGATIAMFASGTLIAARFDLVDALGYPPGFIGVVTGLLGVGSLVASLTSSSAIRRFREPNVLLFGLGNACAGYLLTATGWLPGVLLGSFVLGFALPWTVISQINLSQRLTPVRLQGRVAAAAGLLLFAPQPLANLLGAWAVEAVGYRVLYLVAAVVAAVNVIWSVRRPLR
ncbi:drug:proton antiporter [Saccharopolyspora erythraea NRRL 2338]|uniref:Drug:proton antiporter n=2 Tax=Saccharopolyspora erythraea TaxID=1836 RepID=A4FIV1_SACEN|nr:drug:proton antiporter [Saccharopolyspora erythraea NRRL 2338]